jgi:YD repeat-containing protein
MKNILRRGLSLIILALMYVSCDDDNQESLDLLPIVQFDDTVGTIKENDGEKSITLSFSKPFNRDAIIRVSVDRSNPAYFTTSPEMVDRSITLFVKKNDSNVTLKVKPVDNATINDNRIISFKISSQNEFLLGEHKSYKLSIEDDEIVSNESYVNFIPSHFTLTESETDWQEYQVQISHNLTAEGSLTIEAKSASGLYGSDYVTEPAFENNVLTLNASPGSSVLKFKVKPLNDNVIAGDLSISFAIKEVTGNLKKGTLLDDSLLITDDELAGFTKGYEVSGGNWSQKKFFEYNSKGKIAKVPVQSYTPNEHNTIHTYYYNDYEQVVRINTALGQDLLYHYADGRIIKEEKVDNGLIDRYTEYDYDEFGNVSGYQIVHLQPDGKFKVTDVVVLLYHTDGNLYKKMVYLPSSHREDPYLLSTETFDHYLNNENPFPIVQVLPYFNAQKQLPSSYRLETNGHDLRYSFSYQFTSDGKVEKRITTGPSYETAIYHYY